MNKSNTPLLLTDEQMRTFITQGFLILNTDFSEQFHTQLEQTLNDVYEKEGNPGNNLLPRVREVQMIFDHPVITGALTSVLGPNYMLHAHRHGHYNAASQAGAWHKDSYWGYKRMRNHHPWWAMIMYFPQDTPVELGPTGVYPGSQNYEQRLFAQDDNKEEALASGKAGTFALIHYDIWHRSTPNLLGRPRYMLKFEFMRTEAPAAPSWDNEDSVWRRPAICNTPIAEHDTLWEETWNWLTGRLGSIAGTRQADSSELAELKDALLAGAEPAVLDAAYELARTGQQGVEILLEGLHHQNKPVSRNAAYGLSVSGEDAVAGLLAALDSPHKHTVVHAAFALGELRQHAAPALPKLAALVEHAERAVRQTAAEALALVATPIEPAVEGLIRALEDDDAQVRFTAGLALSRLGAAAESAVPQLAAALEDDNRYVRAHAAEALNYIGTDEAKDVLIAFLFRSRWCPTTTPDNAFYP
ncbi:phytanoyl-CoA dioxygenase [Paenibacillaceae bacterium]|nr:phytanoyl-CoA dioxygenase [Paenibacillaceae bacterium]